MESATSSSASPPPSVSCVVDREVLNADTFPEMTQLGLSVFAPLCGRNRGVFVTNPGGGETYGCASLPSDFAQRAQIAAGITSSSSSSSSNSIAALYPIVDVNAISGAYQSGNLTAAEAVNVVDLLVQSIYNSSGTGVDGDVHACDVSGLTALRCPSVPSRPHPKLRAASLAGVLSSSTPWLTGGKALTVKEARKFYGPSDLDDMLELGLNAVQIPVSSSIFVVKNETTASQLEILGDLIAMAEHRDMSVIVLLEDDESADATKVDADPSSEEATRAAATFLTDAVKGGDRTFVGLILPSPALIAAARQVSIGLNVFVKASEGELAGLLHLPADPHLFLALDRTHTASAADVASSTSLDDRLKLYYHENLACQGRAPVEFGWCYGRTPVYVYKGFNVAVDDCALQNQAGAAFNDYGQCDRLDERVHSPWWHAHLSSFAARQLAGYEAGMGWTFDAWKVYDDKEDTATKDYLDVPAKYYALKSVASAGMLPSLRHSGAAHYKLACLNNPEADFVLGDATLSPTPGPPPDCGNGWWNYETLQCDYWVPPPPCPTVAPTPACDTGGYWSADLGSCQYCPEPLTRAALVHSGLAGGAIGLAVGALVAVLWGRRSRRRDGYSEVPTATINV